MDLTLFIVIFIFILAIYYLVDSIKSLQLEIKEIKNKCINTNNAKKIDFKVDTPDPAISVGKKVIETLINMKKYL